MDEIIEILDRINAASVRMEQTALKYLRVIEQMEEIDSLMEENTND